jgi:hypothetical protein
LFLGRTPALIYGRTILDARAATASDFSWATVETSAQLLPTPTPPRQPPAGPPTPQDVPVAIDTALARVVGPRDVVLDTPDAALKVLTRRLKDANVYLFFNEGAQVSSHSVTLKTDAKTVERWNPQNGTISSMDSTRSEGAVTVKLELKPYQTGLLIMR